MEATWKPQTAVSRLWEYLESVYGREDMLAAKAQYDAQSREYQQWNRDKQKARNEKSPEQLQAERDLQTRQENAEMIPPLVTEWTMEQLAELETNPFEAPDDALSFDNAHSNDDY